MLVTKLLIIPVKRGFFAQKRPNLTQNWHFWSIWVRPCRLIRCLLVGRLVVGARALSRKTPIYFINYLTSSFKLLNPFVWQQKFAKAFLKNSASAKYFLAHNAYKTWKWGRIFSFHTYRQEQYMKISLISNQERFKDSNIFRCNC